MKLIDEEKMSEWAFLQCYYRNDTPEMRNLITDSFYAYKYCERIKDRKEMWKKINHPQWAFFYCIYVKYRPELRKYITNKYYLKELKERRENEIDRQRRYE